MRRFIFVFLVALVAPSVMGQRQQEITTPQALNFDFPVIFPANPLPGEYPVQSFEVKTESTGGKQRSVGKSSPSTMPIVLAIIPVVVADQSTKHRVSLVANYAVPWNTTMSWYTLDAIDKETPIPDVPPFIIPIEKDGRSWAAEIWSPFTGGAPIPAEVKGFRAKLAHASVTYIITAMVNPPQSIVPPSTTVDVYLDGRVFVKGHFTTDPAISFNGRFFPARYGWVTPSREFTGKGVVVGVSYGFLNITSETFIRDIPTPPEN
jgi:hypothetical protein